MKLLSALLVGAVLLHHTALGLVSEQSDVQQSSSQTKSNGIRGLEKQTQVERSTQKIKKVAIKKAGTKKAVKKAAPKTAVKKVATRKKKVTKRTSVTRKRARVPGTGTPPVIKRTGPTTSGSRARPATVGSRTRSSNDPVQPATEPERTGNLRNRSNPRGGQSGSGPNRNPAVTPRNPSGMIPALQSPTPHC